MARMCGTTEEHSCRMLKKSRLLTRPTLAVISPARPESAGTASSPRDAPNPKQGHSSAADLVLRFTLHVSRFLGVMRERCWRTFSASCLAHRMTDLLQDSLTTKRLPVGAFASTHTRPPRPSTICLTIARPSPVPPNSRERALSTR
jgi:hypothetical protein